MKSLPITSDVDLLKLSQILGYPLRVVASDELPKTLKGVENLIINVDPTESGRGGTHWVCLHNGKQIIYFDPFGMDPQDTVRSLMEKEKKRTKKDALIITNESQDIKSDSCGWWCSWFLSRMHNGDSIGNVVSDITMNQKKNEKMLQDFYKNLSN